MHDRRRELIDGVAELAEWFEEQGVTHWAEWLDNANALMRQDDARGLWNFLKAFGGAGSLNDSAWGQEINGRLSEMYSLARELWRDHVREGGVTF